MANNGHPRNEVFELVVPAVATGSTTIVPFCVVPFAGTVTKVTYTPAFPITGAATNNRIERLVNAGQDGMGSAIIATKTYAAGVNATVLDEDNIPLSGTVANRDVAANDVLYWNPATNGTGLADPGGLVHVEITPSQAGHSAAGMVRGFPAL